MITYQFTDKVVLVTGSSRGIGATILEAFARAGATCLLNYYPDPAGQNQKEAEEVAQRLLASGNKVHLYDADVSKFDSVEQMMQRISDEVGALDIVVNNAGVLRDKSVRKMTVDDWNVVMQTNLDGVFHVSKLAAERLSDGGRIVNIASISGIVGFHGQANYAAAKAGVIALTKVLSKELARRQITVNAVAPGVIRTTMLDSLKPEVLASYEQQIPVGRLGRPEEVAHTVLFLASEESGYITGQTIPITGGWF